MGDRLGTPGVVGFFFPSIPTDNIIYVSLNKISKFWHAQIEEDRIFIILVF